MGFPVEANFFLQICMHSLQTFAHFGQKFILQLLRKHYKKNSAIKRFTLYVEFSA